MPLNELFDQAATIEAVVGASIAAGTPVVIGNLPGVTLTATASTGTTTATVATKGIFSLSVKGIITGTGNSAVAIGDILYYVSGDTPKLDKTSTGVRFGYALATVGSGSTGTISVKIGY